MTKEYATPGPRAVHPTIVSSRSLARSSTLARLIFHDLIAAADDQGRHNKDARDVRDEFRLPEPLEAVDGALEELVAIGSIVRYELAGQPFIQLTGWWAYQGSMRRAYPSRHPAPEGWTDYVFGLPGCAATLAEARRSADSAAKRGETRPAAAPARAGASAVPDPTRPMPDLIEKGVPQPRVRARGERRSVGEPTTTELSVVRMTPEEAAAWSDYTGPEWREFRAAWHERGHRLPPWGEKDGDDDSQRAVLREIADARPNDLAAWIRGAPGTTARQHVGYALERWREIKRGVAAEAAS